MLQVQCSKISPQTEKEGLQNRSPCGRSRMHVVTDDPGLAFIVYWLRALAQIQKMETCMVYMCVYVGMHVYSGHANMQSANA